MRAPVATFLAAVLLAAKVVGAEGDISSIIRDWRDRATAVDRVRYVLEGTVTVPQGARNGEREVFPQAPPGDLPPQDHVFQTKQVLHLDFGGDRALVEQDRDEFGGMAPVFRRMRRRLLFTSGKVQQYYPRAENPEFETLGLVIEVAPLDGAQLSFVLDEVARVVLMGHGYDPLAAAAGRGRPDLHVPVQESVYTSAGERTLDERPLVAVRASAGGKSSIEFWIDPERTSAIRKVIWQRADRVTAQITTTVDSTECGWLPKHFVYDRFGGPTGDLLQHEEIITTAIECRPAFDDALFVLNPPPDTVIKEDDGDVVVTQGDGQPPVDVRAYVASQTGRGRVPVYWLAGGVSLLVLGIGLLLFRRRRLTRGG